MVKHENGSCDLNALLKTGYNILCNALNVLLGMYGSKLAQRFCTGTACCFGKKTQLYKNKENSCYIARQVSQRNACNFVLSAVLQYTKMVFRDHLISFGVFRLSRCQGSFKVLILSLLNLSSAPITNCWDTNMEKYNKSCVRENLIFRPA